MKRRKASLLLVATLSCILSTLPASAQQSQPSDELKKDIGALKESVKAIQKDVQEIKALLQTQQPAPPPPNVVLDLGKNPFKGERTAKLTLVEFSDYQ